MAAAPAASAHFSPVPVQSSSSSDTSAVLAPTSTDHDGPLFRAQLQSFVQGASTLRLALKSIMKASEASLASLLQLQATQNSVDRSLEALSLTSSTSRSDSSLKGLYKEALEGPRTASQQRRQAEIFQLEELLERLKSSCERLKSLQARQGHFEKSAKKYYDEVGKYLSRTDIDGDKTSALDSKQAERQQSFERARLEFYYFAESLVESEEEAVALWLREWAGAVKDRPTSESLFPQGKEWMACGPKTVGQSEPAVVDKLERLQGEYDRSLEPLALSSDGRPSPHAKASRWSNDSVDVEGVERKRRNSMGALSLDPDTAKDRLKSFVKNIYHNTPSAPSMSLSPSDPLHGTRGSLVGALWPERERQASAPSQAPTNRLIDRLTPGSPRSFPPTQARKKEGFLWASPSESASGQWHKFWTVLSEGQLVEYTNWKTNLTMRGAPVNLRFATARACRLNEVDRRFCFWLITPSSRRCYQALTQEDVELWVSTISKSIESVLNGTSSVRHFDASRLSKTSSPYVLSDFGGSSTSLAPQSSGDATSAPPIPSNGLSHFASRLPQWMSTPPLTRRPSRGGRRSLSHNGKPSSPSPIPLLTVQQPTIDRANRGHMSSLSEGASSLKLLQPELFTSAMDRSTSPPSSSDGLELNSSDTEGEHSSTVDFDQHIIDEINRLSQKGTSEDKEGSKDRNARALHDLLLLHDNSRCADCRQPEPRWTSWSLGVFICIRCSGIHRSLGSHITKVRSVDLDDWSDTQVKSMAEWGNRRANEYWEAERPPDSIGYDDMANFIKTKYADKSWIPGTAKAGIDHL